MLSYSKSSILKLPFNRREPIDWNKLAALESKDLDDESSFSVEFLQEHLNHVAFCQASEILLTNTSNQRKMQKLFRLAQLIIQYLFISQSHIEKENERLIEGIREACTKYKEVKDKFTIQAEEAKRIKISNKNLLDTVTYLNKRLQTSGKISHHRCSICSKVFREEEFLQAHLRRRHSSETAATVTSLAGLITDGEVINPEEQIFTQTIREAIPKKTQVNHQTNLSDDSLVPSEIKDNNQYQTAITKPQACSTEFFAKELEMKITYISEHIDKLMHQLQGTNVQLQVVQSQQSAMDFPKLERKLEQLESTLTSFTCKSQNNTEVFQQISSQQEHINGLIEKTEKWQQYSSKTSQDINSLRVLLKQLKDKINAMNKPPELASDAISKFSPTIFDKAASKVTEATSPKTMHSQSQIRNDENSIVLRKEEVVCKSRFNETRTYENAEDSQSTISNNTYDKPKPINRTKQMKTKIKIFNNKFQPLDEEITDLTTLLSQNPDLWNEMKTATEHVVSTKLCDLGVVGKKISKNQFKIIRGMIKRNKCDEEIRSQIIDKIKKEVLEKLPKNYEKYSHMLSSSFNVGNSNERKTNAQMTRQGSEENITSWEESSGTDEDTHVTTMRPTFAFSPKELLGASSNVFVNKTYQATLNDEGQVDDNNEDSQLEIESLESYCVPKKLSGKAF